FPSRPSSSLVPYTTLFRSISRSGITISAGLYQAIRRADATRFSFLLATPVIVGAGAKTLLDARKAEALFAAPDVLALGFGLSFLDRKSTRLNSSHEWISYA